MALGYTLHRQSLTVHFPQSASKGKFVARLDDVTALRGRQGNINVGRSQAGAELGSRFKCVILVAREKALDPADLTDFDPKCRRNKTVHHEVEQSLQT